jgi:hypothetical protein
MDALDDTGKRIAVSSYRIRWDYDSREATMQLFDSEGKFIKTGNLTFADLDQMDHFASLFLAGDVPIAFHPGSSGSSRQLKSGPFPVGRQSDERVEEA